MKTYIKPFKSKALNAWLNIYQSQKIYLNKNGKILVSKEAQKYRQPSHHSILDSYWYGNGNVYIFLKKIDVYL